MLHTYITMLLLLGGITVEKLKPFPRVTEGGGVSRIIISPTNDKWITSGEKYLLVNRHQSDVWDIVRPGEDTDQWYSVSFASVSFGVAVGRSPTGASIAKTDDGGRRWKTVSLTCRDGRVSFADLVLLSKDHWLLAGSLFSGAFEAVLFETLDGGVNWRIARFSQVDSSFSRIVPLNNLEFVLISAGHIFRLNLGAWKVGDPFDYRAISPEMMIDGPEVIGYSSAAIYRGELFLSGGWAGLYRFRKDSLRGERVIRRDEDDPKQAWLTGIAFCGKNGVTVGESGAILSSKDQRESWQLEQKATNNMLRDIACEGNSFLAVGDGETLLRIRF